MKPFIINRSAWHYKLNKNLFGFDNSKVLREYWEYEHSDFCSYWKSTSWRVLVVSLFFAAIVGALFLGVTTISSYPWETLGFLCFILFVVVVCIVGEIVNDYIFNFLRHRSNKTKHLKKARPEGLIAQKYRAHKDKICPMIEYRE
jgi:magnesium-transporting ATPase (P-type)